jgi:hypothetical protein
VTLGHPPTAINHDTAVDRPRGRARVDRPVSVFFIEIVDAPDKIEAFMPDLEAMVGDGLITLERAEVLLYRPGR